MLSIYSNKNNYIEAWKNAEEEFHLLALYLVKNNFNQLLLTIPKRFIHETFIANYNSEFTSLKFPQSSISTVNYLFKRKIQNDNEIMQFNRKSNQWYFDLLKTSFLICISLLLVLLIKFLIKKDRENITLIAFFFGLFITYNIVTSFISTPSARYQINSSWPLFVIISIILDNTLKSIQRPSIS